VRLVLETDRIEIWPDRDRSGENDHD
jgi:hypothetical protein